MFEKNMKYAFLVDLYGDLLDPSAKDIMDAYYNEDLSLSEIAEGIGISRQGVRHSIKRSEELLDRYEATLGLSRTEAASEALLSEIDRTVALLCADADAAHMAAARALNDAADAFRKSKR